jgi:hypothetical protein
MDAIVREGRVKKNFQNYYWGGLILTKSYLAWGGANLNAYTMIGIDLRWVDMVGTNNSYRAIPVRNPPPSDYTNLIVKASRKSAVDSLVGFPGAHTPEFSRPVTDGSAVIWGFAVPRSLGDQLMVHLRRRFTDGYSGVWHEESLPSGRVLARAELVDEPEPVDSVGGEPWEGTAETMTWADEPHSDDGMFCGQCGSRNPSSSNFCAKCGERLVKL